MESLDLMSQGAALGVAAISMLIWRKLRRLPAGKPERAMEALSSAADLVALVVQVQQHRGMSGAWLAGEKGFATRLPDKQRTVDALFANILTDAPSEEAERCPCFVSNDIRLLRHQWRQMVDELSGYTPEKSFQAHSRIVSTLLDWLSALGEARIEQPLGTRLPEAAARNFAHRLPVLAECLGQSRALGSAVAAKQFCPPVSRVRLLFLVSRAESLLAMALDSEATLGSGRGVRAEAQRAVQTFVVTLRERVLETPTVTLSADDCFTLATRAVDGVFAWVEAERRELASSLGALAGGDAVPLQPASQGVVP